MNISYSKLIIILGKQLQRHYDPIYYNDFIKFLGRENFKLIDSIKIPNILVFQNEHYQNHNIKTHFYVGNEDYVHEPEFFIENPKHGRQS